MSYVVHYRDLENKRATKVYLNAGTGGHAKNMFTDWNNGHFEGKLSLIRVKKHCSGCNK